MTPLVVIKVGGSLLGWHELPARLSGYLATRRGERVVLIVGGGRAADFVRDLDRSHGLGEEPAHHLALRALDLTAHLLAALFPDLRPTDSVADLDAIWAQSLIPVLAPRRFLDEDEIHSPDPLPHHWDVTTDSIAARVAESLKADELVLLKSAPAPAGIDREQAAKLGLVDPAFPAASRRLGRVSYQNLRDPLATATPLHDAAHPVVGLLPRRFDPPSQSPGMNP